MRLIFLSVLFTILSMTFACHSQADDKDKTWSDILTSTETVFMSMRESNYPEVWRNLSEFSKKTIIDETFKEIEKTQELISAERIRLDFEYGGPISISYWKGFLSNFNPRIVLEESRWEKGRLFVDRAELVLIHRLSDKPAILKLFHENGKWKVGLVETFWGRK
jgi:hypothetical protein